MNYKVQDNNIIYYIKEDDFSVADTFECGQCFRFDKTEDGAYHGVHLNKYIHVTQHEEYILFKNLNEDDFKGICYDFLDLGTDYMKIKSSLTFDPTIKKAVDFCPGIRILKQNSWEAICSFIISQNNNIPRIKGIISRLCENFGEYIGEDIYGEKLYSFPKPEILADKSVDDLSNLRAGFRAKYIIDAAKKMSDGTIDINLVREMDLINSQKSLQVITGVGPKVAQCALLFGFYKLDAFPIDVWIKKALDYFYKDGFPKKAEKYAGIAQQYIFHYIRNCPDAIPAEYKK